MADQQEAILRPVGTGPVSAALAGMTSPFWSAAIAGPPPPIGVETRHLCGTWDISITTDNQVSPFYYIALSEIPNIARLLAQFSTAEAVSLSLDVSPVGGANVDILFRLVSLEWCSLANGRVQSPGVFFDLPESGILKWRSNITLPSVSEVSLPWPSEPLGSSLMGSIPGIHTPALLCAIRPAIATNTIPAGDIHVRVDIGARVSGRGLFGYPAIPTATAAAATASP